MAITDKCMLIDLTVGAWEGRKLDKDASDRVTEEAQAVSGTARVNKLLLPKEVLDPILLKRNQIRRFVYDKTVPWSDAGPRLLTRIGYQPFIQEFGQLVDEFYGERDTLLDRYAAAQEQAEFRLGHLFDPADYPDASELRSKFFVKLEISPVPDAGDFRVALDGEVVDEIKAQMTDAIGARINAAMLSVWRRVEGMVRHFATVTSNTEARFHASTVDNLMELIDILPSLNILDDPKLAQIGVRLRDELSGMDAKSLKKNAKQRSEAAAAAQAILDDMEGFMSAWGDRA